MRARTRITTAQRIQRATERLEAAHGELLQAAYKYGDTERGTWQDTQHAVAVASMARRYAQAVNALARSRKA